MRGTLLFQEPLLKHTTWRVGGPAERFFIPADIDDLAEFLRELPAEGPVLWLGLGSNLLVRDGGVRGTVISTLGLNRIAQLDDRRFRVEAGVPSAKVARLAGRAGLIGAEFLAGIPGSFGGALAMNAGAFGGETWPLVESVATLDRQGEIRERGPGDFKISYRQVRGPAGEWFVAATLRLQPGDSAATAERVRQLLDQRKRTQPTHQPSCGSVFRNPPPIMENGVVTPRYAARLIEQAGLKGLRDGNAQVSEKHANFIVNLGSARAAEIERLIEKVQNTVLTAYGVKLEREVKIVGVAVNDQQTPASYGKVAVLMGGNSAEREISLKSGQAVLQALQRRGVAASGLVLDQPHDFLRQLENLSPDRVFIALHGRGGEDGTMQGFLETLGLPYTGSRVAASAIAMNKALSKQLWRAAGLPVPEAELLAPDSDFNQVIEKLGLPLMIKPAHEGSSVGMTLVREAADLPAAFEAAYRYDPLVLAERYIHGGEYTIAILGERALPVIRLQTPRAFYDYAAKYTANNTAYLCPCGLPADQESALQALALQAFRCLGASGWGRVDMMLDQAGRPWLLEVNTVPGMTDHSLVPMAAQAAGIGFDELVLRILESAWR